MASFKDAVKSFFRIYPTLDAAFFEGLSELLVEGDFPAADAFALVDNLEALCKKEKISDAARARERLAGLLRDMLAAAAPASPPAFLETPASGKAGEKALVIILLFGVNGVGKTTTAAKLAFRAMEGGGKPILAAADTFRAAAIDQLKLHGQRLGARVVAGLPGGDAAACIYDAIQAARAGGFNPVIADTAGRMHTKSALLEELKKIDRVIEARAPDAVRENYLALDATTGSNALFQAERFLEAARPRGVILTKCDSSAKGGVVFPLAARFKLPVLYLCSGEDYPSICPFNAETYVRDFLGA